MSRPAYAYKFVRRRPLTPRMAHAVRLYASGLVPTKKAAAQAVGLNVGTFYTVTSPAVNEPQVKSLHTQIDQMVQDEHISTRKLVEMLSRQSLGVLGNLMHNAQSEAVRFSAARDLADRGADTAKTQKLQVESFTIGAQDAKALAEAMVEAARVKAGHAAAREGDYVKLDGGLKELIPESTDA